MQMTPHRRPPTSPALTSVEAGEWPAAIPLDEAPLRQGRARRVSSSSANDSKSKLPLQSTTKHEDRAVKVSARRVRSVAGKRCFVLLCAFALVLGWLHIQKCIELWLREQVSAWSPMTSGASPGDPEGIPKIIHQMFKGRELPPQWKDVPQTWEELHPGYRYVLWTDESLRDLIASNYPWLLQTYDGYAHDTQRWDASRYAILHHHGGLYADLDLRPISSIEPMLRGHKLLLPHTPNVGLTNALMASTKGHPFFLEALRQLPTYEHRWYHVSKHNTVLSSTGSTFIWAMFMRYGSPEHAALLPSEAWGKCSVCKRPAATAGATNIRMGDSGSWRSPLKHGQGSSWHSWDSVLVLSLYCKMEWLIAGGVGGLVYKRRRSILAAAAFSLCFLIPAYLQWMLGLNAFEFLICRPWIWFIMGQEL